MDRLKVGDPGEVAENALSFCGPNRFDHGFGCQLISGPFDHPIFWSTFSKFFGKFTPTLPNELQRIGIRPWIVRANVTVKDGKVNSISVDVEVEGLFHDLMARSIRRAELLPPPTNGQPFSEKDRRTLIRWWGGSGEALWVILTPLSTEKELRAGEINRKCLSGFGGCSALCELLPGTTSVLDERGEGYGGCVGGTPQASCHPKAGPTCR